MKKLLFSLFAIAMTAGVATAGQDISKEDVRIYIDPGHGGFTSEDRHMTTINTHANDTLDFWETTTNLWKGLKCRQELIDNGVPAANIKLSRVKNGDAYNISLTARAEGANAFGADYFLSIHSDAGVTNHTLIIYNGYTTPQMDAENMWEGENSLVYQETSRAMAETMWPYISSNGIDVFPSRSPYICGDFNFYYGWSSPAQNTGKAGYLGVLRVNTCNGYLCEGYSHQYIPAAQRAMNPDYCGQEGVRYARGIAAWFGWDMDTTGDIMGSVKDRHKALIHKLYNYEPKSIDGNAPINNAIVTLYKGGVEIAKYTCDDEWNGVFVFEDLEPGDDYTIDVTAEGYKTAFALDAEYARDAQKYTVKANETTYPVIYLEEEGYVAPDYYNYPQPDQDKFLLLAEKYEMKQDLVNKPINILEGKTIRREIAHGDSLYVLALEADNKPHIYCVNMKTQELYFELSTEGIAASDENEILPISDIAFTSDSILVACNKVKTNYYLEAGTYYVYAWEKDLDTRSPKGSPKVWFTSKATQTSGNFVDATTGETFAVSGSYEDCTVITTAENRGKNDQIRFPIFTIARKGLIASHYNKDAAFSKTSVGEDYKICVSPFNDNAIIVDGSKMTLTEYALDFTSNACVVTSAISEGLIPIGVNGASYFKYGKSICMTIPKVNSEGANVGIALYDITNGLNNAVLIETTNTDVAATEATWSNASSHVEGADITLYLNTNNTVSRFTTQDVEQTYYRNVYAYDLGVTSVDENYKFSFKTNEDCYKGGKLIFYDVTTQEQVGEIALDNVVEGANEKVVAATELPGTVGQKLNWSVEVSSYKVTQVRDLLKNEGAYALKRAYVTVNKYPESDKFGYIYVSDYAGLNKATNGVYVYAPNLARLNEEVYTGGLTFNKNTQIMTDMNGKVYVSDMGATMSGLWVSYLDDLSTNGFYQFFEGELSNGVFIKNGEEVGGLTSSVSFYKEGENIKLYAYQKNSAGKYVINVYDVNKDDGTLAASWGTKPSKIIALPDGMIDDAAIEVVEQGIWIGQNKLASANKESSPGLMFIDFDGNITFNSGNEINKELTPGNAGGAVAVTKDGKTLAVNDPDGILRFYDVTWSECTPSLALKYEYTHNIGVNAKRIADGDCIEQMAFDYAGNLVASGHYLGVFSIPTIDNRCETPAMQTVTCGKASVAIEEVDADVNAPVEYYNLQGVKVANPSNGIFIKKQGAKATKVIL